MTEELTIEGKQFISSKRASQLSGYAQDYIGQLARAGHIEAQRIGGLWYVYMDSLNNHKTKSDTIVPKPPQKPFENGAADVLVTFEGKDYVSAARAADLTGYHQDYVGQLARAGKISSRQVGNRWYVDREALMAHKDEKDRLLGAVQAASVGISAPQQPKSIEEKKYDEPLMTYSKDEAALMPVTVPEKVEIAKVVEEAPAQGEEEELVPENRESEQVRGAEAEGEELEVVEKVSIPIRRVTRPYIRMEKPKPAVPQRATPKTPGKSMFYAKISVLTLVAIVAAFGGFRLMSAWHGSGSEVAAAAQSSIGRAAPRSVSGILGSIGDLLEGYIARELIYIRKEQ